MHDAAVDERLFVKRVGKRLHHNAHSPGITETHLRSTNTQRYVNPQKTRIKYRRACKGFL